MNPHYIFCHGFGFDAHFWQHLSPYFRNAQCSYFEMGYFGHEKIDIAISKGQTLIGIGHSLGLTKLIQSSYHFEYLIGLNSFINFLGDDDKLRRKRKDELSEFTKAMKKSPIKTLQGFYLRCGLDNSSSLYSALAGYSINHSKLITDLSLLQNKFQLPEKCSTLMISADDDIIVPPEITEDNFSANKSISLLQLNHGKHLLGYYDAKIISHHIKNFIHHTHQKYTEDFTHHAR